MFFFKVSDLEIARFGCGWGFSNPKWKTCKETWEHHFSLGIAFCTCATAFNGSRLACGVLAMCGCGPGYADSLWFFCSSMQVVLIWETTLCVLSFSSINFLSITWLKDPQHPEIAEAWAFPAKNQSQRTLECLKLVRVREAQRNISCWFLISEHFFRRANLNMLESEILHQCDHKKQQSFNLTITTTPSSPVSFWTFGANSQSLQVMTFLFVWDLTYWYCQIFLCQMISFSVSGRASGWLGISLDWQMNILAGVFVGAAVAWMNVACFGGQFSKTNKSFWIAFEY